MKNLLVGLLLLSVTAMGQKRMDTVAYPNEKIIVETDSLTKVVPIGGYMFNRFWDNWFVYAGAGAQVLFGSQDYLKPLDKRITPTFEGGFGKWLHPYFGVRAKMGGGAVKYYSNKTLPFQGKNFIVGSPDEHGVYTEKWHQMYGEVDLMVDLNNIIGGYKPDRFYTAIPYVGAGVDIVLHQPLHDGDRTAMGIVGFLNRFRISRSFDANLEIKGVVVKQTFDRQIAGLNFETLSMLTAGITYRIGRAGSKHFRKGVNISTVVERRLVGDIPSPFPKADTVVVRDSIAGPVHILAGPVAIFFELNRADITSRGKMNLAFIADIIKNSGGARFLLTGSADSYTGEPQHNLELSVRRSKAVKDYLVQVLMVNPDELVLDPVGGIDRYSPAKVNRTVIIRQEQQQ